MRSRYNKEELLCREWKLEKFLLNGVDLEIVNDFSTTKYKKDGVVELIFHDSIAGEIISQVQWRLVENAKYIEVTEYEKDNKAILNKLPAYFKHIYIEYWTEFEIIKLTATEHILLLKKTPEKEFRFEYKAI